jgi:hypothetical protein
VGIDQGCLLRQPFRNPDALSSNPNALPFSSLPERLNRSRWARSE